LANKMFISVEAVRWVFTESKSERSARLVLLAIASHCNDDGYCWPGLESLIQHTKLSRNSVLKAIEELTDLGEVTVERGGRGPGDTNHYHLKTFMELRVQKGAEINDKGAVSLPKRVQSVGAELEVKNKEYIEQDQHIDLVNQAIKESHRTGQDADEILKRFRAEAIPK